MAIPKHVLYSERQPFTILVMIMITVIIVVLSTSLLVERGVDDTESNLTLAVMSIMFVGILLVFRELRIELTETELWFGFWKFGKRVPLDSVEECSMHPIKWGNYMGMGIRRGWDGSWCYNTRFGQAIRVKIKDKKSFYVVTVDKPEKLVSLVNERIKRRAK
ncbi:MAG: DUF3093 family protein [archaeon]